MNADERRSSGKLDPELPLPVHITVFLSPLEREALDWYVLTERREGDPENRGTERLCKTAYYEGLRTIVARHREHLEAAKLAEGAHA